MEKLPWLCYEFVPGVEFAFGLKNRGAEIVSRYFASLSNSRNILSPIRA